MITVTDVYKVFGPGADAALDLCRAGEAKADVEARTGAVVGVAAASLTVEEGEVFVVMGLSGSGKSTLLRTMNRLIEPTSGRIEIGDRDVTAMSRRELVALRRERVAMVFQSFALLPHRNVMDNVAFGLEVAGMGRAARRRRAREAIEQVGLGGSEDRRPDELSGGMQQRVGLARALARDPAIILMDEAFSALDPLIRAEMQDELVALQRERRRTIVFISHDLNEAMRIGDRVAIMQDGRVVQVGRPDEILKDPSNEYVRAFFEGVDVAEVLTAGDVAARDGTTRLDDADEDARVVLDRMGEASFAVLRANDGSCAGVAGRRALEHARDSGEPASAAAESPEPLRTDALLSEIIERVADASVPLPVVDGRGRPIGAVSQGALLHVLDKGR